MTPSRGKELTILFRKYVYSEIVWVEEHMKYLDRNYQCLLKLFQQTKETGFTLIPAMKSRASWICYDLEFQLRLVLNSLAKFNINRFVLQELGIYLKNGSIT